MYRRLICGSLALLLVLVLLVAGCGKRTGGDEEPGGGEPGGAAKPAVGGEVVFAVPADPDTFAIFWLTSAYAAEVTDRVFGGGLIRVGYSGTPEPHLAEAMPDVSADKKTYTFKLRQGIKFTDGKPVTAHDLAFAYEILMSPDYQGRSKSLVDPIESIKALDDQTLQIVTKEVFAPFLFGSAGVPPLPKHILGSVPVADMAGHDFWKNPVGAGPYVLDEWRSGQHTLLKRNPNYWEQGQPGVSGGTVGPFIESIRLRVIPEDNTAIAALEAGELSFADSVDPGQVDRLKAEQKDRLVAYDWNRMGYGYQTFNNEKFPTDIKEVRQALSYALDREAILKGILDGKATIPPGFVPPIHWVFDKTVKGYPRDTAKAAQLLAETGFTKNAQGILEKDGKPLHIKYVATKGHPLIDGIALQSQKDWQALGAVVELVMVDFNTLLDRHMKPGDFNVTFSGLGFSADPHYSFDNYHSRNIRLDQNGVNQGSNMARYRNSEVDRLVEQGKTTIDVEQRRQIYQQAQKLIIDDAVANWIYVNVWTDFARKEIQGVVNWDGYGINTKLMDQWYMTTR